MLDFASARTRDLGQPAVEDSVFAAFLGMGHFSRTAPQSESAGKFAMTFGAGRFILLWR